MRSPAWWSLDQWLLHHLVPTVYPAASELRRRYTLKAGATNLLTPGSACGHSLVRLRKGRSACSRAARMHRCTKWSDCVEATKTEVYAAGQN
jgi:hypothetical protein